MQSCLRRASIKSSASSLWADLQTVLLLTSAEGIVCPQAAQLAAPRYRDGVLCWEIGYFELRFVGRVGSEEHWEPVKVTDG
jgi:hypothetical protein